jgi:hypothetical protein
VTNGTALLDDEITDCEALRRMLAYVIEELERLQLFEAARDVQSGLKRLQAVTS